MNDTARMREIVGSYGGDARRWPAGERAAVAAALAADPGLRAERAAALALDALLDDWARRDLGGGDAAGAAAQVLAPPRRWPWAAATGIAAAVAAAVLVTPPVAAPGPTITDRTAFVSVFTTTPDEESIL